MEDGTSKAIKTRTAVDLKVRLTNGTLSSDDITSIFNSLKKGNSSHSVSKTLNGFKFEFTVPNRSAYIIKKLIESSPESFPFTVKIETNSTDVDKNTQMTISAPDFNKEYLNSDISVPAFGFEKFAPYITTKAISKALDLTNVYQFTPPKETINNTTPDINIGKTTYKEAEKLLSDTKFGYREEIEIMLRESLTEAGFKKLGQKATEVPTNEPSKSHSLIRSIFSRK